MNSTIHNLICAAVCFCIQLAVTAQTLTSRYQMNPELEQVIGKMRTTKADVEVLQILEAIQNREEQAVQVLLAANSVLDLEQRNSVVSMVFKLQLADEGLNAAHTPLLVQLYVNSAKSPLPNQPRPRSFISDAVLQSRLLDTIGSLLHAESPRASLAPGEPLPRLVELLNAARGSAALVPSVQKLIDDAIASLSDDERSEPHSKDEKQLTPPPGISPSEQPMTKPHEVKPSPTLNEEPTLSTPWSVIVVLIVAATSLLWLLVKNRK